MDFCQAGLKITGIFSAYCRTNWLWYRIFLGLHLTAFGVFFALQLRSLYLVNEWISNRPYDVPPNLDGIWAALLFNVYRAQRQERIVQAEMVGLIDRAQSSLVASLKLWC